MPKALTLFNMVERYNLRNKQSSNCIRM